MLILDINKFKIAQARACLSIEELSSKSNVAKSSIFKILKGERKPTIKTIGLLAKALDVDVIELLTEDINNSQ